MDPTNPHNLTKKQFAFVAAYLGSCKGNATKAAIEAGYSSKTAETIAAQNLGKRKIQDAIADWREEVKTTTLREMDGRLAKLEEVESRLWRLIDARAEENMDYAGGGDTGLLVKQRKMLGGGEFGYEITEYTYDTAVIRDLASIYAQIAKETGGPSKLEISGPNGGPVQVSSDLMVDIVTNSLEHDSAEDLEALKTALDKLGVQAIS